MADDKLKDYHAKRDFAVTPEPARSGPPTGHKFVVQRHQASHLHYDFRLEVAGVLKSWAVPKGPPTEPKEKRLAIEVEDHPLAYGDFEGTIPEGQYGAGTVEIWDSGTFKPLDGDPQERLKAGKLAFTLNGHRLRGRFALVKTSFGPKSWLFIAEKAAAPKSPGGRAAPMPATVRPMLATLVDRPFNDNNWVFETKWDGVRALAFFRDGRLKFISRNQKDLTTYFPELQGEAARLNAREAVFDGEIVSLDANGRSSFQALQPRLGLKRAADIENLAAQAPVVYVIFDLIYLDGSDLQELALGDRRRALADVVPERGQTLLLSDYLVGEGVKLFELARIEGYEGIMAKRLDSRYTQKRGRDWQKIKVVKTQDCVVCGYTQGRGGRELFGALVLGVFDGRALEYAGHVGTGFDAAGKAKVFDQMQGLKTDVCPFADAPKAAEPAQWLKPKLVCEVRFAEWTKDGQMRHPSFVGLRADKRPRDCRREIAAPAPLTAGAAVEAQITMGDRGLKLTNLDKVFWPELHLTKRDLIEYYYSIAGPLVPHLADRPMAMKRYPNGVDKDFFWQKDAPAETPAWVETAAIAEGGHHNRYILVNDPAALIYLANLGCIDLNPWSSRTGSLDRPDWLIIDLDPFDAAFDAVVAVALACKAVLDELGLAGYPKTSGATGMHILVPLEPVYTYAQVRQMAEIIAKTTLAQAPDLATIEPEIRNRGGRVYLDWLQNIRGKTVASVYSPRPESGATVSTPLAWDEVGPGLDPALFTIKTVPERLRRLGDLFEPVLKGGQRLEDIVAKL